MGVDNSCQQGQDEEITSLLESFMDGARDSSELFGMDALRKFYARDTAKLGVLLGKDFQWRPWRTGTGA